jgi:hypothetical protein
MNFQKENSMLKNKHLSLGMALRTLVICTVLVGVTALVASRVVSDDKKGPPEMSKEAMEIQKRMMEWGTPGPNHKHLDSLVGEWNTEGKFWMEGPEPKVILATASNKWIHDGRFVQSDYKSVWDGMPFNGTNTLGYDNYSKKFSSVWMDNMSTSMMVQSGTGDASGKNISYEGDAPDCQTGKVAKHRSTYNIVSKDKHVFEMHKELDGKWIKLMEITYTRKA